MSAPLKHLLPGEVSLPWDEGYEAGLHGQSALLCPYAGYEVDAESWLRGWRHGVAKRMGFTDKRKVI